MARSRILTAVILLVDAVLLAAGLGALLNLGPENQYDEFNLVFGFGVMGPAYCGFATFLLVLARSVRALWRRDPLGRAVVSALVSSAPFLLVFLALGSITTAAAFAGFGLYFGGEPDPWRVYTVYATVGVVIAALPLGFGTWLMRIGVRYLAGMPKRGFWEA